MDINIGINEKIVTGRKFRRLIDKDSKLWQLISWWTKARDVEFDDGKTAEEKVGNINGITSDFLVDDYSIAASSNLTNRSYKRFNEFTDNGKIKRIFIDENGKPCIEYEDGADTVLKKLGSGTVMYLGEGSFYDISKIYDDYQSLTVDNFIVECKSAENGKYGGNIHGIDNLDLHVSVDYKLNKSYNSSTGNLKVTVSLQGSAGFSQAEAGSYVASASVSKKVYLIILPE